MTMVYIAMTVDYEDINVCGVYSSRDTAIEVARDKAKRSGDGPMIVECVLDSDEVDWVHVDK